MSPEQSANSHCMSDRISCSMRQHLFFSSCSNTAISCGLQMVRLCLILVPAVVEMPAAMICFVGCKQHMMCMAACDAQYVLGALHFAACHLWVGSYHLLLEFSNTAIHPEDILSAYKASVSNIHCSTIPTWYSWVGQLGDIGNVAG